jgi:hypothetical protein
VSDYNHSEFGLYNIDSGSYHSSYEHPYSHPVFPELQLACWSQPLPPLSPIEPQTPTPTPLTILADIAQVAECEVIPEDPPTIVTYIRSPTPDLHYPSPAPLPVPPLAPPVSPPVRPAAPIPCPASAVGFLRISTPDLRPLVPPHAITDSPIDYKAAALQVEEREPTPVIPKPVEDQENCPPAPVICPPPCIGVAGPHPHQYFVVATPRGEEHHPLDNSGPTYINNIPFTENLCTHPPHFTGVIPFQTTLPHYQTIFPPPLCPCHQPWHPSPVCLLKGNLQFT